MIVFFFLLVIIYMFYNTKYFKYQEITVDSINIKLSSKLSNYKRLLFVISVIMLFLIGYILFMFYLLLDTLIQRLSGPTLGFEFLIFFFILIFSVILFILYKFAFKPTLTHIMSEQSNNPNIVQGSKTKTIYNYLRLKSLKKYYMLIINIYFMLILINYSSYNIFYQVLFLVVFNLIISLLSIISRYLYESSSSTNKLIFGLTSFIVSFSTFLFLTYIMCIPDFTIELGFESVALVKNTLLTIIFFVTLIYIFITKLNYLIFLITKK